MKEGMALQILETACFIEYEIRPGVEVPMDFYTARDFAYSIGLLKGKGELQENVTEPSSEMIERAFLECIEKYLKEEMAHLASIL